MILENACLLGGGWDYFDLVNNTDFVGFTRFLAYLSAVVN
jgi:hypothetical protein